MTAQQEIHKTTMLLGAQIALKHVCEVFRGLDNLPPDFSFLIDDAEEKAEAAIEIYCGGAK